MPARSTASSASNEGSEEVDKFVKDTKNFIDKALGDIGKTSATKQLIIGTTSGWITGFIAMKVGKVAAIGLGSGIILLHIANQKGYIDINWDAINKKVDKISDKIEKEQTGKSPAWMDKVERFVDRKLDKAEDVLKKRQVKAKRWYHDVIGSEHYRATETHVFIASFLAGYAIGMMCGR